MIRPSLSPVDHVRSHPDTYLPGGRLDPTDFATRLAGDALLLGATRTLAAHDDRWWAIAADVDWLASAPLPIDQLFAAVVPFPQAGVNSMRSEILLTAFADHVVTWSAAAPPYVIKGHAADLASLTPMLNDPTWQRIVAFRFEPAKLQRPPRAEVVPA